MQNNLVLHHFGATITRLRHGLYRVKCAAGEVESLYQGRLRDLRVLVRAHYIQHARDKAFQCDLKEFLGEAEVE